MRTISMLREGESAAIIRLAADAGVTARACPMGLVPGVGVVCVRNEPPMPLLVWVRGTLVALGRAAAEQIVIGETQ